MSGGARDGRPEGLPPSAAGVQAEAGPPLAGLGRPRRVKLSSTTAFGPRGSAADPPKAPRRAVSQGVATDGPMFRGTRGFRNHLADRGAVLPKDPDREAGTVVSEQATEAAWTGTRKREASIRAGLARPVPHPVSRATRNTTGVAAESLRTRQRQGAHVDSLARGLESSELLAVLPAQRRPVRSLTPGRSIGEPMGPEPADFHPRRGGTCGRTSPEGGVTRRMGPFRTRPEVFHPLRTAGRSPL